jgi:hypothetical protein
VPLAWSGQRLCLVRVEVEQPQPLRFPIAEDARVVTFALAPLVLFRRRVARQEHHARAVGERRVRRDAWLSFGQPLGFAAVEANTIQLRILPLLAVGKEVEQRPVWPEPRRFVLGGAAREGTSGLRRDRQCKPDRALPVLLPPPYRRRHERDEPPVRRHRDLVRLEPVHEQLGRQLGHRASLTLRVVLQAELDLRPPSGRRHARRQPTSGRVLECAR